MPADRQGALGALLRRWRGGPSDREIDEELQSFVELAADERRRAGLGAEDARRAALLETGGLTQAREAARESRRWTGLRRLAGDIRYGVRLIGHAPAVPAAVVLTLTLAIGSTSTILAAVDAILIRPLGYHDADRLVTLLHGEDGPVAPANFLDWRRSLPQFEGMGAAEYHRPTIGGALPAEKLFALKVTDDLLPLLGVSPALGRFPLAPREVVIADRLWRRVFTSDPSILGRTILLDRTPHVIVGVMPASFMFAPFWATRAELWTPLDLTDRATSRHAQSLRVFARLAPGVTLEQARAAVGTVTAELESRYPASNRNVTVTPLKDKVVSRVRPALVVLLAAVGLVLLVACANVTHLLLVRFTSRAKEVAVRAALGASRRRLAQQLFTETLVLAIAGGALGLLLAYGLIAEIRTLGPDAIPRLQSIALDGRTVGVSAGLVLLATLLAGVAPALRLSRPDLTTALRDTERGSTLSTRGRRFQRALVATQVAWTVTLIVAAALLLRSFVNLLAVDPGWQPDRLVSFVVSVSGSADDARDRRLAFYRRLLDDLRSTPTVASISAINHLPLVGDIWKKTYRVAGEPVPPPGDWPRATYRAVMPGYFRVSGVSILRGREFTDRDVLGSPDVVIVSQRLAAARWPREDALGKQIHVGSSLPERWRTVVGVAKDAVQSDWGETPPHEFYLSLLQDQSFVDGTSGESDYLTIVARSSGIAAQTLTRLEAAVRRAAPGVAISDQVVMTDVVRGATMNTRFVLLLLAGFAGSALLLAAIGLYGVLNYTVAARRREFGIRLALGANASRIASSVIAEGVKVTAVGAAAGVASTVLLGGLISRLLFGIRMTDAPALAGAASAMALAVALACYFPARRASRIDPQQELR